MRSLASLDDSNQLLGSSKYAFDILAKLSLYPILLGVWRVGSTGQVIISPLQRPGLGSLNFH